MKGKFSYCLYKPRVLHKECINVIIFMFFTVIEFERQKSCKNINIIGEGSQNNVML